MCRSAIVRINLLSVKISFSVFFLSFQKIGKLRVFFFFRMQSSSKELLLKSGSFCSILCDSYLKWRQVDSLTDARFCSVFKCARNKRFILTRRTSRYDKKTLITCGYRFFLYRSDYWGWLRI